MNLLLNPWSWIIAGVALCAFETFAPGVFLLWIGIAAIANGLLAFLWPLPLEWMLLAFCAFTLVSVLAGRRIYGSLDKASPGAPFLNQRAQSLIGRETRLQSAIENGIGLAQIDDTVWRVAGEDLPAGARVKIVGLSRDGTMLEVTAA